MAGSDEASYRYGADTAVDAASNEASYRLAAEAYQFNEAPSSSQAPEWACPNCTFLNPDHVQVCLMCAGNRPAAATSGTEDTPVLTTPPGSPVSGRPAASSSGSRRLDQRRPFVHLDDF